VDFPTLLNQFVTAVESGDAESFAHLFTEDAVYTDGFYGPFKGHANFEIRKHPKPAASPA
jgi:ketosteroid isomerase-like protein